MSGARKFIGALAWLSGRRDVTRAGLGSEISVRISEAISDPDYEVSAEARSMASGRAFYGVEVRDTGGATVLRWNNLDASRWQFPESPHTATVLADLCDALDAARASLADLTAGYAERELHETTVATLDRADDALSAGRLLLSSAAFQRAAPGSGSGAVVNGTEGGAR